MNQFSNRLCQLGTETAFSVAEDAKEEDCCSLGYAPSTGWRLEVQPLPLQGGGASAVVETHGEGGLRLR